MIRRLAAVLAIALVALVGVGPAHADNGYIGFSSDGTHWATQLADPLFPASMEWVPGQSEQSSFYVRNDGPTDGRMDVDALTSAPALLTSGAFVIQARVGSGPWVTAGAGQTALRPLNLDIAQGSTRKVTVKVSFDPSTTALQDQTTTLRFRVTMFEGKVKGISHGHGHGNGNGNGNGAGAGGSGLPNTGAPRIGGWLALAAGLIGTGLALVTRRRREADHG